MFLERKCLIRTLNAGIHFGVLQIHDTRVMGALLHDARRVWEWVEPGIETCNELARRGAAEGRISEPVPEIWVAQVIEVIPMTEEAHEKLCAVKWRQ